MRDASQNKAIRERCHLGDRTNASQTVAASTSQDAVRSIAVQRGRAKSHERDRGCGDDQALPVVRCAADLRHPQHHVVNTVVTFEETLVSVDEMARRIGAVTEKWPWLVWEADRRFEAPVHASASGA